MIKGILLRATLLVGDANKYARVGKYDMLLDTSESIQRCMYLGEFEPEEIKWVQEFLSPGDTFVDVGSNFGYYTMIASGIVGDGGRVIAFDPSVAACMALEDNIRRNAIENTTVVRMGLGDKVETRELLLRDPTLYSPSFCYDNECKTECVGTSLISTLDGVADSFGIEKIDMIKMDVGGYESAVIRGMDWMLREGKVHRILVEFNGYWLQKVGSNVEELHRLITSYGFELERTIEYPCNNGEIFMGNSMYVNKNYNGG